MAKHVTPSSPSLGITKQKPMKRTIIRKNKHIKHNERGFFFNKVVSYLKSDSYMYNPLVSLQPTFDFPPPKQISTFPGGEEDMAMEIAGSNKKLIEKVVDFLEADYYLYSPLLANKHVCCKSDSRTPNSGLVETLGGTTSTETFGGDIQNREKVNKAQEDQDLGGKVCARPAMATKTVMYREAVEHVVHQNCCSKSIRGSLLEAEPGRLFVD